MRDNFHWAVNGTTFILIAEKGEHIHENMNIGLPFCFLFLLNGPKKTEKRERRQTNLYFLHETKYLKKTKNHYHEYSNVHFYCTILHSLRQLKICALPSRTLKHGLFHKDLLF